MTEEPDGEPADQADLRWQDEPLSRSARKREVQALKQLGVTLAGLSAEQRSTLPLPDALSIALEELQRLRARGARKRQLGFIGALLRDLDPEPIIEALADLEGESAAARYEHHALERWRKALLQEPDALTRYIDEHPTVDRQQLRQAVERARRSATAVTREPAGSGRETQLAAAASRDSRALFRLLRAQLNEGPESMDG